MALKFATKPVESGKAQMVPAYVPYRTLRNFTDSLKQGIPSRIDRSVMASMSGALQSQLTAALRYLGLIGPSGIPSEELALLVNSEGHARAKVLQDILVKAYPFLFNCFDLKTATPRMVQEMFAEAGASGGTIDKCVVFFLSAAKDAGIELSPHLKTNRPRITRRVRASRNGSFTSESVANGDPEPESQEMSWAQMMLSKFPSFDPAWPDEVKTKWFDGFHRLMRMKLEEEKSE